MEKMNNNNNISKKRTFTNFLNEASEELNENTSSIKIKKHRDFSTQEQQPNFGEKNKQVIQDNELNIGDTSIDSKISSISAATSGISSISTISSTSGYPTSFDIFTSIQFINDIESLNLQLRDSNEYVNKISFELTTYETKLKSMINTNVLLDLKEKDMDGSQ
ncbi:putative protein serine/threonine kinase [Tieghemostelium lacteum]|uniref:Uncharacterized protein n=1 Tax=Tieghemostelium lacteum TaxID=361077 RepID=A0A151ZCF2_TIELA|nr:putative protein serine/threonine kinase [Tieghemostelium lacteum]|eukprot:KYQ91633.1 putative protein serine/threonine kinase [Tieghemostelium lacteum]